MFEKFGIEHQFWKILGNWNPLEEYEFHELSLYQRVILIKTICDYILVSHGMSLHLLELFPCKTKLTLNPVIIFLYGSFCNIILQRILIHVFYLHISNVIGILEHDFSKL